MTEQNEIKSLFKVDGKVRDIEDGNGDIVPGDDFPEINETDEIEDIDSETETLDSVEDEQPNHVNPLSPEEIALLSESTQQHIAVLHANHTPNWKYLTLNGRQLPIAEYISTIHAISSDEYRLLLLRYMGIDTARKDESLFGTDKRSREIGKQATRAATLKNETTWTPTPFMTDEGSERERDRFERQYKD